MSAIMLSRVSAVLDLVSGFEKKRVLTAILIGFLPLFAIVLGILLLQHPKPEPKIVAETVKGPVGHTILTYDKLMRICPKMINDDFSEDNKRALKVRYETGKNTADDPAGFALWAICNVKKTPVE